MWATVVAAAIVTSGLVGCAAASDPRGEAPNAASEDFTGARPFTLGSWNLEYFGAADAGPRDDALQARNARTVIDRLQPDVLGLEEITNEERFEALKGHGYDGFTVSDPRVDGGGEAYATVPFRLALLFKSPKMTLLRAKVIPDIDRGRAPLEATFSVDVNGAKMELVVVVVHFYPFAELDSWRRRVGTADRLKRYLDANHRTSKVAVVGDWNDDIDTSIVEGSPTPFAQFKNDSANYRFTTDRLSAAGIGSTTGYESTIDHHLATNELAALFVPDSSWIERPTYVPDYRGTTSDHYPVVTRYALR